MTDRLNTAVGVASMAATLVVLASSAALVRDSIEERETIAALRESRTFDIRGSQILDPAWYDTIPQAVDQSKYRVRVLAIVASDIDAHAAFRAWRSVTEHPLLKHAEIGMTVSAFGGQYELPPAPTGVNVNRVRTPADFAVRSGIRVVPFSLIVGNAGNVVAAGPGTPDLAFIRDAVERLDAGGPNAAATFRTVTPEISSGLVTIESLLQGTPVAR